MAESASPISEFNISVDHQLFRQGLNDESSPFLLRAIQELALNEDLEEPPGCRDFLESYPPKDGFQLDETFPDGIPWLCHHKSGLISKTIVREGRSTTGLRYSKVPPDSKVYFNYVAFTEKEKFLFDNSFTREFKSEKLGHNDCVEGLELALKSMRVGEVAHFRISPDLAYGAMGCQTPLYRIPGGATLLLTIHMRQFIPKAELSKIDCLTKKELQEMEFEDLLDAIRSKVKEVEEAYEEGQYDEARKMAHKAINTLDVRWTRTQEEHDQREELQSQLLMSKALCSIELDEYTRARNELISSLALDNNPLKKEVYYRLVLVQLKLGNLDKAQLSFANFKRQCSTPPNTNDRGLINELKKKIAVGRQEDQTRWKTLCVKIFGRSN